MNETNQKIYVKINDLVEELRDREDPTPPIVASNGSNISKVSEEFPSVSGVDKMSCEETLINHYSQKVKELNELDSGMLSPSEYEELVETSKI